MVDVAKVLPVESAVKFSPSKENVAGGDELLRSAGKSLKRILVGGDAQPLYWPVRRQKNGGRGCLALVTAHSRGVFLFDVFQLFLEVATAFHAV